MRVEAARSSGRFCAGGREQGMKDVTQVTSCHKGS